MDALTLALVQTNLQWQDAETNRQLLQQTMDAMNTPADLIILPEMFTSAFSMDSGAVAEYHPGETLEWMQEMAARTDAAITGSIAVSVDGHQYNRLLFVTPEQKTWHYDKRHLFRMLGENKRYSAGEQKLLIDWRGWRILPLVCYDLRFPVWCRNNPDTPYDLMLFVANWPAARAAHWTTLLQARAIENLSYVAGVNRIGVDGKGLEYDGASAIYDAEGRELVKGGNRACIVTARLSLAELKSYRERFPAHLDADQFRIY